MNLMPKSCVALSLMLFVSLGGCADSRRVTHSQFTELERSMPRLHAGMSKDDAFSTIPQHGHRYLIGATEIEGHELEEWAIEARWQHRWDWSHDDFRRYLYFIDDTLADVTVDPLSYMDREALVARSQGSN